MAPPTYQQKDKLVEVAQEGFALLDENYARSKKSGGRLPTNQCTYVYHGPQINTVTAPVIDSSQAVQFYGGMEVVDHNTDKLVKVALEGFALLDEFYGRPRRSGGMLNPTTSTYDHHQSYVYQGPQAITVREPVIDSTQAAVFYDGVEIVNHGMRKTNSQ
ncbi:hypothetical protein WN944_025430 [Citrus x changshan-huyou]|uniref:Uncharacterized protein n=1 Tax=Citrus x changshan-huyou TaxID=2935761 RepID=A0AAP0QGN3_9ROSI